MGIPHRPPKKPRGRPKKETTQTPEPQFTEPVKIVTVKDDIQPENDNRQNNDVNILTLTKFYSSIANEAQMSSVTKMLNVKKFTELHKGFQFPNHMADSDKIRYMEYVAHFNLYEVNK